MPSKYARLIHSEPELSSDLTREFYLLNPTLRLRKYGAWLMLERDYQDRIAKEQAQENLSLLELVKKIAREKDIDIETAWSSIQGSVSDDDSRPFLIEYLDDIKRLQDEKTSEQMWRAKMLTIFFQTRAQGLINGDWHPLDDWGVEDTMELDDKQLDGVNLFINAEQNQLDIDELTGNGDEEIVDEGEDAKKLGGKSLKQTVPKSSSENTTGIAPTPELQQAV